MFSQSFIVKAYSFLLLICCVLAASENSFGQDNTINYQKLIKQAKHYYQEKSYALAHAKYKEIQALSSLTTEQKNQLNYQLANTKWRELLSANSFNHNTVNEIRDNLITLAKKIHKENHNQSNQLWADIHESLGDSWIGKHHRNISSALSYYQSALAFWSESTDIDYARTRYFLIVENIIGYAESENYARFSQIPLDVLENTLKISKTKQQRAQGHYYIARHLYERYDNRQPKRIGGEFEQALSIGNKASWYDDALYYYAQWAGERGRVEYNESGNLIVKPDYEKAVKLYKKFLGIYKKGKSPYYDQVKDQLNHITNVSVGVRVSNIFLPDAEPQFYVNWRNARKPVLSIYSIDLANDIDWSKNGNAYEWLSNIKTVRKKPLFTYTLTQKPKQSYDELQQEIHLHEIFDKKLMPGSYLVEIKANGKTARDVLLITDAAVVLKSTADQALVYFSHANNGKPIVGADVMLWAKKSISNGQNWQQIKGKTDQDGIVLFDFNHNQSDQYFVSASKNTQIAFATSDYNTYSDSNMKYWKIYVYTDRPAYRPGETVYWKTIARVTQKSHYQSPRNDELEYEITDAKNNRVSHGDVRLNEFGSAWGEFKLTKDMALGSFYIRFRQKGSQSWLSNTNLLQLEEYKLPEFKVGITTSKNTDSVSTVFQLGDDVNVTIQADYYFGGPVTNADVETVVYQKPFYHWWHWSSVHDWYYHNTKPHQQNYYGRGSEVKRVKLSTDNEGRVQFSIPTNFNQQDQEYTIEARVVDASRREIIGQQSVRVTRQPYYIYLKSEHQIYRPGENVVFNIKAVDANNQSISAQGGVKITREYWQEVWVNDDGETLTGQEKRALNLPKDQLDRLSLIKQKYKIEEITKANIETDQNGETKFHHTMAKEGFYKLSWVSRDKHGVPIKSEVGYWVVNKATKDLSYRHGGLQIIPDKETYKIGDQANILLMSPSSHRHVLFSIAGNDLLSWQQVYMDSNVKLLTVDIKEEHIPNSFIELLSVTDLAMMTNQTEIIVPPEDKFIQIDVESDRENYQPGEQGSIRVTTKDANDKPISAEISLALVDESIYYIQSELAKDPRQFFYGEKRHNNTRNRSTFDLKNYLKKSLDADFDEMDSKDLFGNGNAAPLSIVADAPAQESRMADGEYKNKKSGRLSEKESVIGQESSIIVRSDFRTTAFWQPNIVTDNNGQATTNVILPDNLTTWKAMVRAVGGNNNFGQGESSAKTQKPLIARLQAPRFFVTKDKVIISGVFNNNTDKPMKVKAELIVEGLEIKGVTKGSREKMTIQPGKETRVDWEVLVHNPGLAEITLQAVANEQTKNGKPYTDAMVKTYPVFEHGMNQFIAKSGKILKAESVAIQLDLPAERKIGSTQMKVQVTSSLAVTMLDALPYLIDYPYGCTEQTMSRFLPTAIVANTMGDLGLKKEDILTKVFGGIEQQFTDKTHSKGKKPIQALASMIQAGYKRLLDMQHSSGAWGWWKEGSDDLFMTAYVVWGLTLAQSTDNMALPNDVNQSLARGRTALRSKLIEADKQFDLQAWVLHGLASQYKNINNKTISDEESTALNNLWRNREKLSAYSRALFALSTHYYGEKDRAKILVDNLQNGVKLDRNLDKSIVMSTKNAAGVGGDITTAHWGSDDFYWHWSEGSTETTAFVLMALLTIDPEHELIQPTVNWLIKNRRASQWSNTRDTAIVVLALNEYLKISKEIAHDIGYTIKVNGQLVAEKSIKQDELLSAPTGFLIDPSLLKENNTIELVRTAGSGPLYYMISADYFSLEDPISAAGNELFVERQYYKLTPIPTLLSGYKYQKELVADKAKLKSGDRIESRLIIEGKNHYEYLMFEDFKPAGFEAVQLKSGSGIYARELTTSGVKKLKNGNIERLNDKDYTNRQRWVHQELRDRKIVNFVDKLPQGYWEIRYQLRAEVPGYFHALPTIGQAMYVPEIKANSSEIRVTIQD